MKGKEVPKGKFAPKKPFIKPTEMPLPEVMEIVGRGQRLPRGTVITGFPAMPEVSVSKIKVTFLPTGEVKVPRYEETEDGRLRVQRYDTVKDVASSIRRTWHQVKSIESEDRKIDVAYARIQGLHEALVFNWNDYNPKQRGAAIDYALAIAGSLAPKRGTLTDPHKLKAIERLDNAAELLGKGNINAAAASLIGSANDVIARKNALIKQKPLLERRGSSIARRKFKGDKAFYEMLDRVIAADAALTGPRPVTEAQRERLGTSLIGIAKTLGRKEDRRLKQCASLARNAANNLEKDRIGRAIAQLRLSKKTMINVASESTVLFPERLEWVARHKDAELKRTIVRNQLRFFEENVEYWLSRARPEQVSNMHRYILNLGNALSGAEMPQVQDEIGKAADLFQAKRIKDCREQIRKIVPTM